MDPSIRSQDRFRTQQSSARTTQFKAHDIPQSTMEDIPPLPAGSENFTIQNTLGGTFVAAVVLVSLYVSFKIYLKNK